jgi:hypothetical protein
MTHIRKLPEYQQGYASCLAGFDYSDNPYWDADCPKEQQRGRAWRIGWQDAHSRLIDRQVKRYRRAS